MLYDPAAHERLIDVEWDAERVRTGVRAIVADVEAAFDDGWPDHPLDEDEGRLRTLYIGGAGVVDALRRLDEPTRDYVPYLERSLEAPEDFPGEDAQRSFWMGETGIRLVLERLAPSRENREAIAIRLGS